MTGFLLYSILDKSFSECLLKLNRIEKRIAFVENEIFAGKEKEMVNFSTNGVVIKRKHVPKREEKEIS